MPIRLVRSSAWLLWLLSSMTTAQTQDYAYAPVPFTAVQVDDGFWLPRMETNRVTTVWYDFQKCEETGRIDNFAKAAGLMAGEFRGIPYDDSDVYKVVEGASYMLAMRPDPKLDQYLDALIAKFAAAQEPDGYLYTARRLFAPENMPKMSGPERWSNLASSHELYNVGHLYEAAVAHFQATQKRSLLNIAIRNADLLCATFGPGKLQEPPGHEEIEIGLVKLYRVTADAKYLKLAKFFLDVRGRAETHTLRGAYQQDHKPVVQQDEAVGHAVRAGYLYSGMADVAAMTGDQDYIQAIDRLWEDVVGRKLHLTGGIGANPSGEAFGDAYELPNRGAYLETCAAIANALWNQRMFLLHGDARYVDVLERVLYNGFLAGVSLSGDRFFYPNPLESDGKEPFNQGSNERAPWFGCSCCPVNVVRFIPSIANCIYATRDDSLYVNLFVGGSATAKLGERVIRIAQHTRYPWEGSVRIEINPDSACEFALHVRISGWARGEVVPGDLYRFADAHSEPAQIRINGQACALPKIENGYAVIRRTWNQGDSVELDLPMPVRRVLAHEKVKDDRGRVAVQRGPIVYCVEGADNAGQALNLVLPDNARFTFEHRDDLLGGVTLIRATGLSDQKDAGAGATSEAEIVLIPYYAWNHRGPNPMAVWLARASERQ